MDTGTVAILIVVVFFIVLLVWFGFSLAGIWKGLTEAFNSTIGNVKKGIDQSLQTMIYNPKTGQIFPSSPVVQYQEWQSGQVPTAVKSKLATGDLLGASVTYSFWQTITGQTQPPATVTEQAYVPQATKDWYAPSGIY